MNNFFPKVKKIKYEGADSKNPLAFKHYKAKQKIMGKTMAEHLRFAVCYWHTFKGTGADPFGPGTILRDYNNSDDPMQVAEMTMQAAFEFYTKLGVGCCASMTVTSPPNPIHSRKQTLASTRLSTSPRVYRTTPVSSCCGEHRIVSATDVSWLVQAPTPVHRFSHTLQAR